MAVRLNSPLYEDGPWLKDPVTPDLFRQADGLGKPVKSEPDIPGAKNKNAGGSSRRDPSASITSVRRAFGDRRKAPDFAKHKGE
jgi:hypothetical protein